MKQSNSSKSQQKAVQTTGHAWDGDIQEFNNPLPRWWLWGFYATVAFAIIYWVFYPTWPVGDSYTKGVLNTITYEVDGKEVTTHWNTRALLVRELQQGEQAIKQRDYLSKFSAASYDSILQDAVMLDFTRSVGRVLFADNCGACHGIGGQGKVGLFPSLVDDDWLWGGKIENIHQSIVEGRRGFMPAFKNTFTDTQLDQVVDYVLSLSGHEVDGTQAKAGAELFNGQVGGCHYCHEQGGSGRFDVGSANLTDSVWTIANVNSVSDLEQIRALVRNVILNGVSREMPSWKGRLSAEEMKLLTVYVYDLGSGN